MTHVDPALTLDGLVVGDSPEAWASAGFAVGPGAVCNVGGVEISLAGPESGRGITGWVLGGAPASTVPVLDGIPTKISQGAGPSSGAHPNGVTSIDHVVLLSPDLDRTAAAFSAYGNRPRRERIGELGGTQIRQIFFRFGAVIVEVIGSPAKATEGPSTLWGITYVVADIDAATARFGERTSPVKDAVQPGRRISTLRHREFSMSVRTALISATS